MDQSDTVAVVALSVSLIALLVALGQISQQFLGSADGYRRCKEEVIGAWALRVHRKRHWYEFRFETRFTVPNIDLLSANQYLDECYFLHGLGKGLYLLNTRGHEASTEEIYYTVHPRYSADNELLVSWIPFLQKLHQTYQHYWQNTEENCCTEPPHERGGRLARNASRVVDKMTFHAYREKVKRIIAAPTLESKADPEAYRHNREHTSVVITYRELSWDFMPSDVVRPFAMTHMKPFIIMATRLGMQWQEIKPKDNALRASGNGYNLSSFLVRDLGTVVQFGSDPKAFKSGDLIPSLAADKMVCGILPGDRDLVVRNYPLVGDDETVSGMKHLLNDLGLNSIVKDLSDPKLTQRLPWWEENIRRPACNDAVILLCPFMPPDENSNCCSIQFLGFLEFEPCSTFCYYESRTILLSEATKRARPHASNPTITYVYEVLAELKLDFPDYFYGHFLGIEEHPCPRAHGKKQIKTRAELVEVCRASFTKTTKFSKSISGNEKHSRWNYSALVGSYVAFAYESARRVHREGFPANGSLYLKKFNSWPVPDGVDISNRNVPIGAKTLCDITWMCVDRKDDFVQEVRRRLGEYLSLKKFLDEENEAMWWMLMLRGVCWAMAIRIEVPREVIPSSFYENRTPIWIT